MTDDPPIDEQSPHETPPVERTTGGQVRRRQDRPSRQTRRARLKRLAAAIQTLRERLDGATERSQEHSSSWWALAAAGSLEAATSGLQRGDLDGGWSGVHDAERFLVFGMTDEELLTRAASLNAEAQCRLPGWRANAITRLFEPIKLADWMKRSSGLLAKQRALLENVVVECLAILRNYSEDTYRRVHLAEIQLHFLVIGCGLLLAAILTGSRYFADPDSVFGFAKVGSIMLAGALGGVVSAMYRLSRAVQTELAEALLHGVITMGRPLIGAASAMFIYAVVQSNVISLIDPSKLTFESALVLAFVAGFSEQFVLSTVAKVTGEENAEENIPGSSRRITDDALVSAASQPEARPESTSARATSAPDATSQIATDEPATDAAEPSPRKPE